MAGDLATVRALLANPVDVNNRNDDNGWTVLMVADGGDHVDVVAELVAHPEIDVNARGENDRTALHLAAERGHERAGGGAGPAPGIDPNRRRARAERR